MPTRNRGFTLIEIAIVLVIIGLLLGGVLKGQELITQAKIRNIANDLNGLSAGILSYQDRYRRLPGDDPGATRWSLITAPGNGNSIIEGSYEDTDAAQESRLFWAEMRLAGFLAGDTATLAAATQPATNAANGIMGVQWGALGLSGLVVCSGNLPAKVAQALDAQFDDGAPATGNLRAKLETTVPTSVGAGESPAGNYQDNNTNLYVVCKSV